MFPDAVRRWQNLHTSAIEKDYRLQQNRQQWLQFRQDLANLQEWLTEARQVQATQTNPPGDIQLLEIAIRRHRVWGGVVGVGD